MIKEATSEEEENGSRFSTLNLQFSPFPEIPTPLPISEMELPSFYPAPTPPSGDPSPSLLPMDSYPAENQFSSRFSTNFISNFIVKQSSGEKSEEKEVESEKNIKKEIKKQILEEMLARTVKSILQDKFKKLNKKNQIKNAKKFTNKLEKILKNLILPIFPENEIFWREKLMKRLKSKFDGVNFDEKCEKEPWKLLNFIDCRRNLIRILNLLNLHEKNKNWKFIEILIKEKSKRQFSLAPGAEETEIKNEEKLIYIPPVKMKILTKKLKFIFDFYWKYFLREIKIDFFRVSEFQNSRKFKDKPLQNFKRKLKLIFQNEENLEKIIKMMKNLHFICEKIIFADPFFPIEMLHFFKFFNKFLCSWESKKLEKIPVKKLEKNWQNKKVTLERGWNLVGKKYENKFKEIYLHSLKEEISVFYFSKDTKINICKKITQLRNFNLFYSVRCGCFYKNSIFSSDLIDFFCGNFENLSSVVVCKLFLDLSVELLNQLNSQFFSIYFSLPSTKPLIFVRGILFLCKFELENLISAPLVQPAVLSGSVGSTDPGEIVELILLNYELILRSFISLEDEHLLFFYLMEFLEYLEINEFSHLPELKIRSYIQIFWCLQRIYFTSDTKKIRSLILNAYLIAQFYASQQVLPSPIYFLLNQCENVLDLESLKLLVSLDNFHFLFLEELKQFRADLLPLIADIVPKFIHSAIAELIQPPVDVPDEFLF